MFGKQETDDLVSLSDQGQGQSCNDQADPDCLDDSANLKMAARQQKSQSLERCFDFLCDNQSYKVSNEQTCTTTHTHISKTQGQIVFAILSIWYGWNRLFTLFHLVLHIWF